MYRFCKFYFLLVLLPIFTFAQKRTIDLSDKKITHELDTLYSWGKVSEEDLKMTRYTLDTAAEAVILFDIGFIQASGPIFFSTYNRHKRIKILKKGAFQDVGNVKIPYSNMNFADELTYLRAQVIQPDGTIIKLTKDDFFDEKLSNTRSVKKITFPKLMEGSIVEYSYQISSKRNIFTLRDWYFQDNFPILHSALYMDFHETFGYQYVFEGAQLKQQPLPDTVCVNVNNFVLTKGVPRFYLDSVPAMKEESFITTMDDYRGRVRFQLAEVTNPYGKTEKIFNTWDDIAKALLKEPQFGEQIHKKRNYNAIWNTVKKGLEDTMSVESKIKHIYTYLAKNLEWKDNDFSFFVDETLEGAFKKRKANSGEMNLMLIACLNEADIKAYPLLISTRDNGRMIDVYPIVTQFNHVLCYTVLDGKPLCLDVGSPNRPMGTPRIPSLNKKGLLITGEKANWVDIKAPTSWETTLVNFTLSAEGTYEGNIVSNHVGYTAVNERDLEKEADKEKKIKEFWLKEFPEIKIDSIVALNTTNLDEPFKRTLYCKIPNAVVINEDYIYLKPIINDDFSNNPLKLETRNYPIEFPYPIKSNYVFNITLPEGYVVEEMPKMVNLALGKNDAKFYYENAVKDNQLQISMRININKTHFEPTDYQIIKDFFKAIAMKYNEQIVLKKSSNKALEERK